MLAIRRRDPCAIRDIQVRLPGSFIVCAKYIQMQVSWMLFSAVDSFQFGFLFWILAFLCLTPRHTFLYSSSFLHWWVLDVSFSFLCMFCSNLRQVWSYALQRVSVPVIWCFLYYALLRFVLCFGRWRIWPYLYLFLVFSCCYCVWLCFYFGVEVDIVSVLGLKNLIFRRLKNIENHTTSRKISLE